MHVIGNMWFLFIFGDNVEDYLGHFKYLVFYIFVGLIAMATQVMVSLHSTVPTLGASGAIAGVLGAYFVLYPRARVLTWFFVFVVWVPAWIILGYWFALQFLSGTASIALYAAPERGRSGLLGACWRICGGSVAGESFWRAGVAVSVRASVMSGGNARRRLRSGQAFTRTKQKFHTPRRVRPAASLHRSFAQRTHSG